MVDAIETQVGILFLALSAANIESAPGQDKLVIPIGAKPKGKLNSYPNTFFLRDLFSTFLKTLGSNLIWSRAILLISASFSSPDAPSIKSKTNLGRRLRDSSLASFMLKIF